MNPGSQAIYSDSLTPLPNLPTPGTHKGKKKKEKERKGKDNFSHALGLGSVVLLHH